MRKARERDGNADGNRGKHSDGRRWRWECCVGASRMHHSSCAVSTEQGRGDPCTSHPCPIHVSPEAPPEQNPHWHLFPIAKLVPRAAPLLFHLCSSTTGYHLCRSWPDTQISTNECLKAPRAQGSVSLVNQLGRSDGISHAAR